MLSAVALTGCSSPQQGAPAGGGGGGGQPAGGGGNQPAGGGGGGAAAPERVSINLRLAHFWPMAHVAETHWAQGWAKLVSDATDGQVTVTSYPGETLAKADEIYDAVVNGIADVGASCFAYTRGRFPLIEVFELPGIIYRTSAASSMTAWEGIQQLNPAEVQDTRLLMVISTGPGVLATKKPVRTLDDLKGMQIRATGLSAKTLELLGAIPVAMPQSDAYEALQRAVVGGNLTPSETLEGWRHAEVTEYVTMAPFLYNTLFFFTINHKVWDSIPAHLQDAIQEATDKYFAETAIGLWDMQNDSGLNYAVNDQGLELIYLDQAEQDKWMGLITPMHDDYVNNMAAKGLDGAGALALAKELAAKYDKIYDPK